MKYKIQNQIDNFLENYKEESTEEESFQDISDISNLKCTSNLRISQLKTANTEKILL